MDLRVIHHQRTNILVRRIDGFGNDPDPHIANYGFADPLPALHFEHGIDGDAGLGGCLVEGRLRRGPGSSDDHLLAVEISEPDMAFLGEPMVLVHDNKDFVLPVKNGVDIGIAEFSADDADIAAKLDQLVNDVLARLQAHRISYSRTFLAQRVEQFHNVIRPHGAEFELAGIQRFEGPEIVDRLLLVTENVAGDPKEVLAFRRELDPSLTAMQKLRTEVFFKVADVGGDRRLSDMEVLGRRGETLQLDHIMEGLKPLMIH